jgi:hypothetical protein
MAEWSKAVDLSPASNLYYRNVRGFEPHSCHFELFAVILVFCHLFVHLFGIPCSFFRSFLFCLNLRSELGAETREACHFALFAFILVFLPSFCTPFWLFVAFRSSLTFDTLTLG